MSPKNKIIEVKDHLVSGEHFRIVYDEALGYAATETPETLNLSDYYPEKDYASHQEKHQGLKGRLYVFAQNLMLRYKLNILRNHGSGINVLDVGGGIGVFAEYVSKKGYAPCLTEPNLAARQRSEKKGIPSFKSLFEIQKPKRFDTLTLWHVLEHVEELNENLQKCRALLRENGLILIAVPNINSYDSKHYGAFWAALDVPRHQWHFTPSGLKDLLNSNGFSYIQSYPMWFDAFYIALLSETYAGNKWALLRGLFVGLYSNFRAAFNGDYSSKIFVFKKNN